MNTAGSGFSDTDLSSLKLTLTGTGTASDIDSVKIYFDSNCDSAGGTLIGTGTYSGNPATVTFYNRGQHYRRFAVSPDGDRGEWFAVAPAAIRGVA